MGYLRIKFNAFVFLLRMIQRHYFFRSRDLLIHSNVSCRYSPGKISIGKKLIILNNAVLEFNNCANISIGDNCIFSYGCVIAVRGNFHIGHNVMVGEYTSIRDFSHNYQVQDIAMIESNDVVNDVTIGNNVWIGRGSIIMPGSTIEDGVVVGANSVVKGVLKRDGVYAGAPATLIKMR